MGEKEDKAGSLQGKGKFSRVSKPRGSVAKKIYSIEEV